MKAKNERVKQKQGEDRDSFDLREMRSITINHDFCSR
jgi:hypothetical protein